MASPTLKFKRGVFADLPSLAIGEPGFTTDKYQLFVGSPTGNQLIGGGEFWNLNSTTVGGGIKLYEGTNNGTDFIELKSNDSLSGITTYSFPVAGSGGQFLKIQSLTTINGNSVAGLGWADVVTDLVDDTSPQLGGNLDLNSRDITGTGDLNFTGSITLSGTVDGRDVLDDGQAGDNLVTLSGVARDATNLGTFTGTTIADSETVKGALQDLETELETIAGGGAQAATLAIGSTDTNSSHFLTFVSDNNTNPTQEAVRTDAGISYNPSTNTLTATNIAGALTGDVTGDVTGTATQADKVKVVKNETTGNYFFTFVDSNNTTPGYESLYTDTALNLNPATNIVSGGGMDMVAYFINGVEITATATELNVLDGVTAFLDEDNMASDSATAIPSQQSVKAYVDSTTAGVAVTFNVAADSGTTDLFQTGQTLRFSGTAGEVETAVTDNTLTFGLPATVNITTELDVPTIETGAIQAKDGTAAVTIADSNGKVTVSTDQEVQGTFTAAGLANLQGNVDIGNATSDTVTVTGRFDSDLVPSTDGVRSLGSSSLNWDQGYIDRMHGESSTITGIATATEFKGTTLTLTGGGSFGGNVNITGNLSVGGSVTNIDVEDLRIVSPVIELGLQRLPDGSLQPPAEVTTYNSGVVMYYNHVGVSSANAKIASMFAAVKPGGSMRIGFATDVAITNVGTGGSVASVTAWADIEAKGLWMNDCAGQSQVISCSGSTRFLENITVDGGTFA